MTTSLGFRTDLMLLALRGSTTERRDGYLVVRTVANPSHHWGNFLLLPQPPGAGTLAAWRRTFEHEFPGTAHVALGVDGTRGDAGDQDELIAEHLHVGRNVVLTTSKVRPPARPNRSAQFRMLDGDDDWDAALALKEANNTDFDPADYHEFAVRKLASMRRLQDEGFGAWFGAFAGDVMVSGLGVFGDGSGTARFQSVDTHPEHRQQGLAGSLVHLAGKYARDRLHAHTLVIVADPSYVAIRLYRALGFAEAEVQVQLLGERHGSGPSP
jgi:ribosomal protein S18 acetylase RimI-like enzyme